MKSILVVDDVRDLADSTADLLRLLGYSVRTAYNGRDAVEAAVAERPDVVLLDLNMPVMDGFEAAMTIRCRYASPPPLIVAVSALASPAIEEKLRESGFDHYVTKPADVVQLIELLEQDKA
jgi:CheY-like chemotaxis protein